MKNLTLPAAALAVATLFTSCNESGMCLQGEGDVETRTLDLSSLEGVNVNGNTHVFISKGSPQRVEVQGQPNVLDELEKDVRGGVWDLEFSRCLGEHETVQVYITVPELTSASVDGSGYVEVKDEFRSDEFDTSVSGSGDIKLKVNTNHLTSRISGSGTIMAAGVANSHDLSISGSGNNNSSDLNTMDTEVDISGSGKAEVNAKKTLEVDLSGSGRVYHKGNPKVSADVSGSGKVISQ